MAKRKTKPNVASSSPASKSNGSSTLKIKVPAKPATKANAIARKPMSTLDKSKSAPDWRIVTLAEMRRLILEAEPSITEERKWRKPTNPDGVPVWSREGIICTGETYKQVVKLTFAHGAAIADPRKLFNASLEGNTRRAIDLHEGEQINAAAFKALVKAAVALNASKAKPAAKSTQPDAIKPVKRLAGGNPQIAKADGDAPVQAYIAAMPSGKREIGEHIDALVERTVPKLRKAVKWNSPFYGVEGQGWFLSFHVFTKYVKVTFFQGTLLKPPPAGGAAKEARWIDLHSADDLDEAQLTSWIKQAAALPGWLA